MEKGYPMKVKFWVLVWMLGILVVSAQAQTGGAKTSPLPPSEETAESADELQPGQEVEFKAKLDGSIQKYIIRLPKDFKLDKEHDLMIGLHGHGSDRHQYAQDERGECKGARDVAGRHKMIFVSPDYREKTSWMGPAAEEDMVQLIGDIKQQYKIRLAEAVRKHNAKVFVIHRPQEEHRTSYEDTVTAIEFIMNPYAQGCRSDKPGPKITNKMGNPI
jgi:hypothetical protein